MKDGLTLLLLGVALTLGVIVTSELHFGTVKAGGTSRGLPPPALAEPSLEAGVPAALPPLAHFAATRDRPLFFSGRRFPEPLEDAGDANGGEPDAPPAPKATLGSIKLYAIVINGAERVALISDGSSSATKSRRVGASVDSWTVEKIERDTVVLRNGPQTEELKLFTFDSSAPPAAAPPVRKTAAQTRAAAPRDTAGAQEIAERRTERLRKARERAQKRRQLQQQHRGVRNQKRSDQNRSADKNCGLSRC